MSDGALTRGTTDAMDALAAKARVGWAKYYQLQRDLEGIEIRVEAEIVDLARLGRNVANAVKALDKLGVPNGAREQQAITALRAARIPIPRWIIERAQFERRKRR